jgi:hypothetical protein
MILPIIISLLGFPVGILLYLMTKEEFKPGKKYFIFIKESLYLIFVLITATSLIMNKLMLQSIIVLISAIIIFLLYHKINHPGTVFFPYLLYLTGYFLIIDSNLKLLLSSIIFLYGLPAGTLFHEKKRS